MFDIKASYEAPLVWSDWRMSVLVRGGDCERKPIMYIYTWPFGLAMVVQVQSSYQLTDETMHRHAVGPLTCSNQQ